MFQVASRPAPLELASGPLSPMFDSPLSPASALVQLPRTLARPSPAPISRDALVAASPELADVPLEYIRAGLAQQAPAMLAAIQALAAHIPASAARASLPPAIALPASATSPTHVLAISPSAKTGGPATAALFPTHQLLLLSSCALLPALPAARAGAAPVVPLALPSAETFPALHAFLYARCPVALLSAVLCLAIPASAAAGPSDRAKRAGQLAHALLAAAAGDAGRLMAIAKRVNGLWRNACALGVHEPALWDTLDLAWDAVLGAMNAIARR